jgi:AMMECR1 domain-containing protein
MSSLNRLDLWPRRAHRIVRHVDFCRAARIASCAVLSFAFCLFIPIREQSVAREENRSSAQVSNETIAWLLKQARGCLSGKQKSASLEKQAAPLEAKQSRRTMLFITTFSRRGSSALASIPAMGTGDTLTAALKTVLDSISIPEAVENSSNQSILPAEPDRIQIDILDGSFAPLDKPDYSLHSNMKAAEMISIGEEGIAVENGGRMLCVLPSGIIYNSIASETAETQRADDLLDRATTHLGLASGAWRSPQVKLSRFRTLSFVEDASHNRAVSIASGFARIKDTESKQLIASARAGGDYLVRVQKPDGSFHYSYDALKDRFSAQAYNILRHAGAAFSLFDLYRATHDVRYLDAARRAVSFLKTRFRPSRESNAIYVLDNDGKAKLGANGLALLALTRQMELDPKSADPESAVKLANLILLMQRKDGSFESYYSVRGDEPQGSVSLYYPGEALLGIVQLFKLNGDNRLLDSARRGAEYLIESQRRMTSLPPDAWLMQALEVLFKVERTSKYAEHAIALAETMIAEQYTEQQSSVYAGGFRPGLPRSTPAASRAEGMVAAYRLARSIKDSRASKIASALKASAWFQLSQQFSKDNTFFLPDPTRAAGGFREGITSMRIRIDFVQHNISSLLGVAEAIY